MSPFLSRDSLDMVSLSHKHSLASDSENSGCFSPIPVRSGHFGLGRFSQISRVSGFGPIGAGHLGPI